ncbi:hypothetical protein A3Q56_04188 [Intoshia linei]|uniref:Thymidylate kinase n=1 Tax=Intoshia linei TaxID=1819745 RepID=A0A177B388_9BILA|nr:hypothetical protein A3Q56_04188 [Intoshia linei]
MSNKKRGVFIVVEGLDRSGKSTAIELLCDWLNQDKYNSKIIKFPDRTTETGSLIDSYLKKEIIIQSQQSVHLMFTANRWELQQLMHNYLQDGINLLVDRYSYSGIAFSNARGLDIQWCKNAESGLLCPDHVFFFEIDTQVAEKRGDYGNELYELVNLQNKVKKSYCLLFDNNFWTRIDASKSVDEIQNILRPIVVDMLKGDEFDALQYF